jgi:hypothetical protein
MLKTPLDQAIPPVSHLTSFFHLWWYNNHVLSPFFPFHYF